MAKKGFLWILAAYMTCVLVPIIIAGSGNTREARSADDPGVTKPILVYKVDPQYPEEARQGKLEGVVVLKALIDQEGGVKGLAVVNDAEPVLAEAAMAAVRQWRYKPATDEDNVAIAVNLTITVQFRLS